MGAYESNLLSRAQAAVDAARAAYVDDPSIDLEARVTEELAAQELEPQVGDPIVEGLAADIRNGVSVPLEFAAGPAKLEGVTCVECESELEPTIVGEEFVLSEGGQVRVAMLVELACPSPDCLSHGAELAPPAKGQ